MLAGSFLLMVLYEIYWIRYFRSEKRMEDFYSSLLGIPVAGATLPVAAFFAAGSLREESVTGSRRGDTGSRAYRNPCGHLGEIKKECA